MAQPLGADVGDVGAGPATVTLPDGITGEDRLRVVQAILDLGSVNG